MQRFLKLSFTNVMIKTVIRKQIIIRQFSFSSFTAVLVRNTPSDFFGDFFTSGIVWADAYHMHAISKGKEMTQRESTKKT